MGDRAKGSDKGAAKKPPKAPKDGKKPHEVRLRAGTLKKSPGA